jgi:hypothetical protein
MSNKSSVSAFFILVCLVLPPAVLSQEAKPRYDQRWFYASKNLLVDASADELIALIGRAGKSGYNGLVLADYKFNILDQMPDRYFQNVQRVRREAAAAHIDIIPAVFPIGYSNGLLAHDPNLAEGLPVERAPFVVKGREAVLLPDASARLVNGDLEQVQGDRFIGFSFQDDPEKTTFADHTVVHHGKTSCRMQDVAKYNPHGLCRLVQRVAVRPHACYRFSCWVKTKDFHVDDGFRLLALGTGKDNRSLTFYEAPLEPTKDWSRIDVVFNSLDEREVTLYAGQ